MPKPSLPGQPAPEASQNESNKYGLFSAMHSTPPISRDETIARLWGNGKREANPTEATTRFANKRPDPLEEKTPYTLKRPPEEVTRSLAQSAEAQTPEQTNRRNRSWASDEIAAIAKKPRVNREEDQSAGKESGRGF